MLKKFKVMHIH